MADCTASSLGSFLLSRGGDTEGGALWDPKEDFIIVGSIRGCSPGLVGQWGTRLGTSCSFVGRMQGTVAASGVT